MSSSSSETEKNSKPPEPEGAEPPPTECREPRLVPDDSEEYEEQQTGIELSYVLKEGEVYECLKYSGRLKKNRKAFLFASAALAALTVIFSAAGVFTYRGACWFFAALCAVSFAVLNIFPLWKNRKMARGDAGGSPVRVTIYPDRIEAERGTWRREIPLDGTVKMARIEDMLTLYLKERMLIIPMRCISPRVLPDVQAMLAAGTNPKKIPKF